jgi:hypothetical protein
MTLLYWASFQLENSIVPHSHHHCYAFLPVIQSRCTRKNVHQQRRATFSQLQWWPHCQENVAHVSRRQIWTMAVVGQSIQIWNLLNGLQTDMCGPHLAQLWISHAAQYKVQEQPRMWPVSHITGRHFWNAPPTASLCWHPLLGFRKRCVSECQWAHFLLHAPTPPYAQRNSVAHLCFMRTSMWDAILWDCSSAAICRMATEFTHFRQEGSTSTVIPPASASNVGQHDKIGGIAFKVPLVHKHRTPRHSFVAMVLTLPTCSHLLVSRLFEYHIRKSVIWHSLMGLLLTLR